MAFFPNSNKSTLSSLDEEGRISMENLRKSLQQAGIKIADATPPETNLLPWDDSTSEISNPNQIITSGNGKLYANSTYWILIPVAVVACLFAYKHASSIMRMCSTLGRSIHSGVSFFAKKPSDTRQLHVPLINDRRAFDSMC